MKKPIIIAGPCSLESEKQVELTILEAQKRDIDFIRANLWKPRTKVGFEGLGDKGLPLLIMILNANLNPALEAITPNHAKLVIDTVLPILGENKLLLWIGSRNQNHFIQREIAQIASQDPRIFLLIKNQPWISEEHWEGIIDHVLSGGIQKQNILNCHRGFAPGHHANPENYRNIPNHEMALRVKEKTGISMLFDPSHTGGSRDNVLKIARESNLKDIYDGMMIEVHPDPENAMTDPNQQLTWNEFDLFLENFYNNNS